MKIKLFRTSLKIENMWIKDEGVSDEYLSSLFLCFDSNSDNLHIDKSHFDLAKRFIHAMGGYNTLIENTKLQIAVSPDSFA